jgi:hypothetical protein
MRPNEVLKKSLASVNSFWVEAIYLQGRQNVTKKNRTKDANLTAVFRSPSRLLAAKRKQTCHAPFC